MRSAIKTARTLLSIELQNINQCRLTTGITDSVPDSGRIPLFGSPQDRKLFYLATSRLLH